MIYVHQPVLLDEVLEQLQIKKKGFYIDATFGRGGHSREILNRMGEAGKLLVIDKDPEAISHAKKEFLQDSRVSIKQGSFMMLKTFVEELGWSGKINGILLDLGVSSPQLDDAARGFSFLRDGPLDMRMDPTQGISASEWINSASKQEIERVLIEYGEERFARRIAAAIVRERAKEAIVSTGQLAVIVSDAHPAWEKHKHPATRTFQAIRIFLNQELDELQSALQQALDILAIGGRLLVISFHSLEDRIVKRFIQRFERGNDLPAKVPVSQDELKPRVRRIAWGIKASEKECAINPRARSAVLRVAEKLL